MSELLGDGLDDDDAVFRAISDRSRRTLLDKLFLSDGQTLGQLCEHLSTMTRYGVMSHLRILEEAGLVTSVRGGRWKHHYLNPVPIRRANERWISKFNDARHRRPCPTRRLRCTGQPNG